MSPNGRVLRHPGDLEWLERRRLRAPPVVQGRSKAELVPRFLGGSGCLAPADEARVTDDLLMLNNEVQLVLQDGDKSGVPSRIVGADDAHHPRPVQCRDLQPALVAEMDVRVVDGHARHAHPVVRPSPLPRPTTAPDIACKPTTPCQLRQSSSRSAGRVRERLYALDWSAPGVLRSPTGSFEPEGSSWPVATAASRQAGCTRRSRLRAHGGRTQRPYRPVVRS